MKLRQFSLLALGTGLSLFSLSAVAAKAPAKALQVEVFYGSRATQFRVHTTTKGAEIVFRDGDGSAMRRSLSTEDLAYLVGKAAEMPGNAGSDAKCGRARVDVVVNDSTGAKKKFACLRGKDEPGNAARLLVSSLATALGG